MTCVYCAYRYDGKKDPHPHWSWTDALFVTSILGYVFGSTILWVFFDVLALLEVYEDGIGQVLFVSTNGDYVLVPNG